MGGFAPFLAIKLVHFGGDHFSQVHSHAQASLAGAQSVAAAPQKAQKMAGQFGAIGGTSSPGSSGRGASLTSGSGPSSSNGGSPTLPASPSPGSRASWGAGGAAGGGAAVTGAAAVAVGAASAAKRSAVTKVARVAEAPSGAVPSDTPTPPKTL
jgi:hypothetical protein